jgi:hypothetical protein
MKQSPTGIHSQPEIDGCTVQQWSASRRTAPTSELPSPEMTSAENISIPILARVGHVVLDFFGARGGE